MKTKEREKKWIFYEKLEEKQELSYAPLYTSYATGHATCISHAPKINPKRYFCLHFTVEIERLSNFSHLFNDRTVIHTRFFIPKIKIITILKLVLVWCIFLHLLAFNLAESFY